MANGFRLYFFKLRDQYFNRVAVKECKCMYPSSSPASPMQPARPPASQPARQPASQRGKAVNFDRHQFPHCWPSLPISLRFYDANS